MLNIEHRTNFWLLNASILTISKEMGSLPVDETLRQVKPWRHYVWWWRHNMRSVIFDKLYFT